jgi:tetratricopeptide (TPR) repeat protein
MGLHADAEEQARLDAMPGDALEKRGQHAVSQLRAAGSRHEPLVIVMDDLHWADLSSIELLTVLIRLARDHRLLFLLMQRPGFSETSGRIQEQARTELAGQIDEILLEPLDDRAARALLNNLFPPGELPHATRRLIEEKAQGNPFYIEEVVRALVDAGVVEARDGEFFATDRIDRFEIPGSVQEVVQSRGDGLEVGRRQLLQTASVVGQTFHLDVLLDVAADGNAIADQLQWLMDAEFLVPSDRLPGEEYAFKHPLIQEVTYDGLLQMRREELHCAVGGAIERRLGSDMPGFHGMLAYHFGLGKDLQRAEAHLFEAGSEAARAAASNEALQFFQEASRLYLELYGDDTDPHRRATLEKNVASALYYRGRFVEAIEHYDEALALLGDPLIQNPWGQRARFALDLIGVLRRLYLPTLGGDGPASEREREIMAIRYERAEATVYATPTRHVFDGMRSLARLQRVDPRSVPDGARMYAGAVAFFAFGGISFDVSRRLAEAAFGLVNEEDAVQQIYVRVMSFIYHFLEGDWDDAHEIAPELIEASLARGDLWAPVTYLDLLAHKRLQQGDWDGLNDCRQRIDEVWDVFQYDLAKTSHYYMEAGVAMERGLDEEARRAADVYFDENPEELLHIVALGTRAKAEVQLGELERAGGTLEAAEALMTKCSPVPPFHASFYLRSRLLYEVTRLERAREAADSGEVSRVGSAARRSARAALGNAAKVSLFRAEILQLAARASWLRGRRRAAWRLYARSARAAARQGLGSATCQLFGETAARLRAEGGGGEFLGHDAAACEAISTSNGEGLGATLHHSK